MPMRACGVELACSVPNEVAVKLVVVSGHGPWMESPWEARDVTEKRDLYGIVRCVGSGTILYCPSSEGLETYISGGYPQPSDRRIVIVTLPHRCLSRLLRCLDRSPDLTLSTALRP